MTNNRFCLSTREGKMMLQEFSRCFTQEKSSRFARYICTEKPSSYSCDVKNHKENFAVHVTTVFASTGSADSN